MKRAVPLVCSTLICCAAIAGRAATAGPNAGALRPLQVDDLFERSGIARYFGGSLAFAPDGRGLAFTLTRPTRTLAHPRWNDFLWGNATGEIYYQPAPEQPVEDLSNGATAGVGDWAPEWSPDGSRLAFLSTRDGGVTLWLWDKTTKIRHRVSSRHLALQWWDLRERPFVWRDSSHLIGRFLAADGRPVEMDAPMRQAANGWEQMAAGKLTVSVIDSVLIPAPGPDEAAALFEIEVGSGQERCLAQAPVATWSLSPTGRFVAFLRPLAFDPATARHGSLNEPALAAGLSRFALGITRLEDGQGLPLDHPLPDVVPDSLAWSDDELAVLSFEATEAQRPSLRRIDLRNGRTTLVPLGGLQPAREAPALAFAGNDIMLQADQATGRREFWLIDALGGARCLTKNCPQIPAELFSIAGTKEWLGLAAGELWRIKEDGAVEVAVPQHGEALEKIIAPARRGRGGFPAVDVLAAATAHGWIQYDARSGQRTELVVPEADATLLGWAPSSQSFVWVRDSEQGLRLWRTPASGKTATPLAEANRYLREIDSGQFLAFTYKSAEGETLQAWLLLPPAAAAREPYPVIAWIYPGTRYRGSAPPAFGPPLDARLFAAHGYAVLFPSIPLSPGTTADPAAGIAGSVAPALDALIAKGQIDPQRQFVAGASYGGYGVLALLAKTHRFKAAIALAAPSDLSSYYGSFDAQWRYGDHPHTGLAHRFFESGQGRMGVPPWQDGQRYLRNSPLFFADRVDTPLMLVQGDLDYTPLQQGEEFFSALYRQGKRVQFVRYWGEGHLLFNPENIRDLWARMLAWFDEFDPKP